MQNKDGLENSDLIEIEIKTNNEVITDLNLHNNSDDSKDSQENLDKLTPKNPKQEFKKFSIKDLIIRFNSLNKKNKIIFIGIISFILILLFVFINIGLDEFIFRSNVQGVVLSENQEAVEGAKVQIESVNTEVKTDSNGKFEIKGVKPGSRTIKITDISHKDFEKQINIGRFDNPEYFFDLEFSDNFGIKGKLSSSSAIKLDQLSIQFDSRSVDFNNEGFFEINNLEKNEGKLVITSPFYKDLTNDLTLKPGSNDIGNIELTEAFDQKMVLVDWLTQNKINNKKIKINSVNYETDNNGFVFVKDLDVGQINKLTIETESFVRKEIELPNNSGDQIEVEIINDSKVVFTSQRTGNVEIFTSNVDGSSESKITNSNKSTNINDIYDNSVYFYTSDALSIDNKNIEFFSTPIGGGEQKRILNTLPKDTALKIETASSISKIAIYSKTVTKDNVSSLEFYIKPFNSDEATKIYERKIGKGNVINFSNAIISQNGNVLSFSLEEVKLNPFSTVYSATMYYDINKKELKTIFETEQKENNSRLLEVSHNGQYILFQYFNQSGNTIYGLYNSQVQRFGTYENLNISNQNIKIDNNNEFIYFISIRDGRSDVYRLSIKDGNVKRITESGKVNYFGLVNNDILGFETDNDLYLINPKLDKPAKKTNIVTDFGMWRDSGFAT
jgi:hypothetical protein